MPLLDASTLSSKWIKRLEDMARYDPTKGWICKDCDYEISPCAIIIDDLDAKAISERMLSHWKERHNGLNVYVLKET